MSTTIAATIDDVIRGAFAAQPGCHTAGEQLTVDTPFGACTTIVGDGDELDGVFMNGHCHSLALALVERTGGTLVATGDPYCETCNPPEDEDADCQCLERIWHLAVKVGDVYVDGEGQHPDLHGVGDVYGESAPVQIELTAELLDEILWHSDGWVRPDLPLARAVVDAALDNAGISL